MVPLFFAAEFWRLTRPKDRMRKLLEKCERWPVCNWSAPCYKAKCASGGDPNRDRVLEAFAIFSRCVDEYARDGGAEVPSMDIELLWELADEWLWTSTGDSFTPLEIGVVCFACWDVRIAIPAARSRLPFSSARSLVDRVYPLVCNDAASARLVRDAMVQDEQVTREYFLGRELDREGNEDPAFVAIVLEAMELIIARRSIDVDVHQERKTEAMSKVDLLRKSSARLYHKHDGKVAMKYVDLAACAHV